MEKRSHGRETEIPNKLYFRIGEVSDLVGVKPYVLRYWESEFQDIKPTKSKSGQRLYKRRDVEMLVRIRELLYEERFTINGARKRLKDFGKPQGDVKEAHAPVVQRGVILKPEHEDAKAKQFEEEVEDTEEIVPREEPVPVKMPPRAAVQGTKEISRESTKVLIKIKRDLESLLSLVRE